jgi:HTH-type transcriptional regulator, sugar sensing transcriptional regulator
MNAEHIQILQTLGIKGTESKVYLALLETGKSLAGTIANRAHLHRRNTYDALEQLLQKGMVSYIISNNKKYWTAASPEKILTLLKENENLISSILPNLISTFNSTKPKQTVEISEGLGGMKTFFDDMANSKKEIIMLFATGNAYKRLPLYMEGWDKKINTSKIKVKVLLNPDAYKTPYKNYKYGEIKTLSRDFSTPTQIFIYGDKSAVAIWSEEPIAILISSKEITEGFRKYFQFLWKISKK